MRLTLARVGGSTNLVPAGPAAVVRRAAALKIPAQSDLGLTGRVSACCIDTRESFYDSPWVAVPSIIAAFEERPCKYQHRPMAN